MQVTTLAQHGRNVPSHRHDVDHAAWTAARLHGWLSTRHSLPIELALILGVYAVYECTRGLVAGDQRVALHHAQDVISLERSLHLFVEGPVQHAALAIPGLIGVFPTAPPRLKWLSFQNGSDSPIGNRWQPTATVIREESSWLV